MLEKVNNSKKGYIIVDFPRSSKQASLFVKEVGHVDFIIYLYATTDILIKRVIERPGPEETEKFIKETQNKLKEIREALNKYNYKIEKIYTDGEPAEVSANIQAMLIERLKSKAEESASLDTKSGSAHTSPFTAKKVTSI
ncbi:uncharacterized protein LOC108734753 [Agrilus planipennis]|uniref:Uncharacterized protein LOC108734753 n=1 Tax=Agrilus planipennis TaxID=224129 RepID=A0A7F5RGY4_AGRPL|nr:uncharacterized protein LOC108734753 [Agrilus planipennis]